MSYGPTLAVSKDIHASKYRSRGESFEDAMTRVADALADDAQHFNAFRDILLDMRFLPAGRVQAAMGSPRRVTPYNCFVSGTIQDSFDDIMLKAHEAGTTMRLGGGIGYDFSTLRPRGELIKTLESKASGPISFMMIYDAICKTIASAGHRRGAQMGVLRVDHPDIEEFIRAKQNEDILTAFNISVGVTDEFMHAVLTGSDFDLRWGGKVYKTVDARALWNEIMRSNWDWAEPGVLFLDTANRMNNLWYCETLAATNPCAEQWLPPYGACLLGSFNLTRYVEHDGQSWVFNYDQFFQDIPVVVRAMDNVVDRAIYPLPQQEKEAKAKRRMGLGVTGLANCLEALGYEYGSVGALNWTDTFLEEMTNEIYLASAMLAREKGPFPLFNREKYLQGRFIQKLDPAVREAIRLYGIRNSHLTSIAPTGTISLAADNVSSGIEPVFSLSYDRLIQTEDGQVQETVEDYGYRVFGVAGKTAEQCSVDDHLNTLLVVQEHIDSSVSKTCNVGPEVSWEEFQDIYLKAWRGGAKGCTVFRTTGKRAGILKSKPKEGAEEGAQACYFDPETGTKTCDG